MTALGCEFTLRSNFFGQGVEVVSIPSATGSEGTDDPVTVTTYGSGGSPIYSSITGMAPNKSK